jgi:hypothetical protein
MPEPDASRCPICGAPNRCAMELARETGEPQPPCWCTQVDFDAALLDSVPLALRGAACICARCAQAADAQAGGDQSGTRPSSFALRKPTVP